MHLCNQHLHSDEAQCDCSTHERRERRQYREHSDATQQIVIAQPDIRHTLQCVTGFLLIRRVLLLALYLLSHLIDFLLQTNTLLVVS
jgi:hypothetical protein